LGHLGEEGQASMPDPLRLELKQEGLHLCLGDISSPEGAQPKSGRLRAQPPSGVSKSLDNRNLMPQCHAMKVAYGTSILVLAVVVVIACNNSGNANDPSTPTAGVVKLQAAVSFTSSNQITAYLRVDFFVDGSPITHLESSATGTSGSDLKEFQTSLSLGTHSISASGTYGTAQQGGSTFSKTPTDISVAAGKILTYMLTSDGGSDPVIRTSQN